MERTNNGLGYIDLWPHDGVTGLQSRQLGLVSRLLWRRNRQALPHATSFLRTGDRLPSAKNPEQMLDLGLYLRDDLFIQRVQDATSCCLVQKLMSLPKLASPSE